MDQEQVQKGSLELCSDMFGLWCFWENWSAEVEWTVWNSRYKSGVISKWMTFEIGGEWDHLEGNKQRQMYFQEKKILRRFNIQMWDDGGGCIEHRHRKGNEKV